VPAERVRKRYLQLAKRLHPDKSTDARAPEAFAALEHAHGVLMR
jgi:curved DNA-binding protein CbpA